MRIRSFGWLSFVALVGSASAAHAEAGAPGCTSTDGCASPTPYCSPALHACVECLTSLNCAVGLACDAASGACVKCTGDGDCPQERPYCAEQGCVECRTATNCQDSSLQCVNGTCGKCGDGICSARERLGISSFGPVDPTGFEREVCIADCREFCPGETLTLDASSRVTIGSRNLFENQCGGFEHVADAHVVFTAPKKGKFYATVTQVTGDAPYFWAEIRDGAPCGDYSFSSNCNFSNLGVLVQELVLEAGATAALVLESPTPATLEVKVTTTPPPCTGSNCPTPPEGDAAAPNDQGKTLCLQAARDRGEELCEGVTCACSHCPRDYDDCAVIPGCAQVSECLRAEGCVGEDCFDSGACRNVISTYGGKDAPAFRAANALQSCSLAFACGLPCGDAGAGAAPDGGAPEAGSAACVPDTLVRCACDGGTGLRACGANGSYGECVCDGPVAKNDDDSSCGCTLSRTDRSHAGVLALLGLVAGVLARRRGRARPAQ